MLEFSLLKYLEQIRWRIRYARVACNLYLQSRRGPLPWGHSAWHRRRLKNAQSPPPGIEVASIVGGDADAAMGVVRLCDELQLEVELACGISVQVRLDRLKEVMPDLTPNSRVVIIVCGGNGVNPEIIMDYRHKLENGWQ